MAARSDKGSASCQPAAAGGADAEHVADRDDQVGAVQRVEMELVRRRSPAAGGTARRRSRRRPAGGSRDRRRARRNAPPSRPGSRRRTPPPFVSAGRNWSPAGCRARSAPRCRPPRARSRKPQEHVDIEEELGDRPVGAGIELALEIVEVVAGAARLGMGLGIGGDADLEIGDALAARRPDRRHRHSRRDAARNRRRQPARRVAAQRHDMADARPPNSARATASISSRVAATQVRCAAGSSAVSWRMRRTVAWVRSRVEPPAP